LFPWFPLDARIKVLHLSVTFLRELALSIFWRR
jgi:hypothetical protein